ncbi:MAG: hypothetical protein QM500_10205 [Methylococcales bacterium]
MNSIGYINIFDAITNNSSQAINLKLRSDLLIMLRDQLNDVYSVNPISKKIDLDESLVDILNLDDKCYRSLGVE